MRRFAVVLFAGLVSLGLVGCGAAASSQHSVRVGSPSALTAPAPVATTPTTVLTRAPRLHPTYMTPDFTLLAENPSPRHDGSTDDRKFVVIYAKGHNRLDIAVSMSIVSQWPSGYAQVVADPTATPTTVRGHEAVVTKHAGEWTSLTWEEAPNVEILVNGRGVDLGELQRVAEALTLSS